MKTRQLLRSRVLSLSLFISLITLLNSSFSQTVTRTYTAPSSVSIDGCGTYCSSLPGVTFVAADFAGGCSITDVNVSITWAKTDGTCAAPLTGSSFHAETSFRIDGPMGINEVLVQPGTYSGTGSTSTTTTLLDQAAGSVIGGVNPVSGAFRPNNGNLNNFNGSNGLGTWFLRAGDTGSGDPLCIVSYSVTLTMAGTLDNASFSYPLGSYCVNASDPTPTVSGDAGGTFTSTAGLSINASTGAIDVSASTPGTYSVTYTTPAPCSNSSVVSVTINALDNPGFNYSAATYCTNASDPTPTITGLAGGTFSSTAGLSINASTGAIDVSASTAGTYTVTYTTSGSCPNSSTASVTINTVDNAGFNYSAAAYCVDAIDPTPTITGLVGGTFSSTAGLSINASTGAIDVSASTPGTYTVTYTTAGTCPNSSAVSVTINALDNAGFNYSAAAYCVNDADPTATITGLAGGTFSSTAGLSINASTGAIDVSASTPGTYTVTYATSGTCPNSSAVSVTINALDNAGFNYSAAAYCVDAIDPTPTITGLAGGTFSSTAGLSINASTGAIDVSASTPGTYTVTYTTAGSCPNSSAVSVTVNALDNAGFNYSAAAYCVNDADPTPTITGLAGGTFSSTAGLSINASTGVIDVSASTPGTYTVTYATSGTCPNSSAVSVTINALDNAGFNYSAASYCSNISDPTPTITGLAGGTFSSTAGLSINASTGVIDVSASTPGTYTITYSTSGACPNSSTASVTINTADDAGFNYSAATYCVDEIDPTPTITGLVGGTFSSTAGLSINASTGAIDVSASTAGTYTVTYTTNGACPNSSTVSVTINALDDAGFNYSAAAYCVDAIDPTPTITGVVGGTFSSTAGLSINASTGAIDVSASTPGTYTVTYTTSGTCPNSSTVSVTINALDDAGFSYSAAAYCVNTTDPTPTITGLAGGTFSSTAGLSINASTGAIDVSASTPGTYTVTYTTSGTCPNSSTVSVTINALDDAGFNYSAAAYCVDAIDPTPTITGVVGGTFSSTAGLSINASTGAIDVSASTPGTYTITYTTSGTCPNSSTVSVTINALDDAGFNYSAAAYCVDEIDPTPTITGLVGGTFSSTAGLSINASTGAIDVSASTPGTYIITYTTSGTCPNSSTVSVTINALDDAGFNYSAAAYCVDAIDPTPTITGVVGGTFSSTAGLSINASTGAIDVSASTPGTYTITYTTSGTCPNSSTVSVTINALDDAGFNYSAAAYCVDAIDPTPTITGLVGGTFSSTAGLSINASTGAIDVSASTAGTYTVTYTTNGTCPNSSTVSVTINALDDAGFNYSAAAYCVDAIDPTPTITGVVGGTFSSTAGLSINASTGAIDVSASTAGTYTVTYTTSGTCPNSSTVSVTINALDDAGFNYSAAAYCVDAVDPTPTITGVAGGTFSSTAGLSINASTGAIDVSASTAGTYTVTYTTSGTCPNSSTVSVTINALDDAGFNYSAAAYCVNTTDPTPTITGLAGGTFSSTAGLSINASTGVIDVSASTPGTYTVTYSTSGTCPNSSTVSVVINNVSTGTDTQVACDSYTWIDGMTYTVSNNTATFTLTNAAGCDSVVTLNLTINNSTTGTDTQVACDSYTWIDGTTYTVSNNTATFTLTNAAGCDSVVTLNLTINNTTSSTDTQVACDSYTWIDGNTYTASNNVASVILTNAAGCDSIITLDLTINYSASSSITEVSCGDYASPGGNVYTTSGTYTELLSTVAGCDSTLTIYLTIENVDVSVSVADITMTANYAGGNYQWINCATLAPIAGATGQSFTPVANGSYAVIVSTGNCSDTSLCTVINSVELAALELAEMIQLYPNPVTENYVTIGYDGVISSVDVYDVLGRAIIVGAQPIDKKLDVSSLSYGKYIVRITTETLVVTKELIIAK